MKGVLITLGLLMILFGMNGCYTVLQYSNNDCEPTVYIEQPIIVIEEPYYPPYDPGPPPVIVPNPPADPKPIFRPVEQPENGNGNSRVRDDLRNNGRGDDSRGNDTRNSSTERNRNGR